MAKPVDDQGDAGPTQAQEQAYRAALAQLHEEGKLQNRLRESAANNMKTAINRLAQGNAFFRELDENPPKGGTTMYSRLHYLANQQMNPGLNHRPRPQPKTSKGTQGKKLRKIKTLYATPKKRNVRKQQDLEDTQTEHDTIHKAEPAIQTSPEKHTGYRSDMIFDSSAQQQDQ